ncbi:unnamed protein product [Rotaria sordida]|uniref:Neurotransmitter-gated ion-channel ligand-binding domain-containing protein n=1 Tax=Rotaria sordida TaxID=392033 RepID=A0A813YK49_9BILA|nr:unnamed protein product [Rotaria sordida]
MIKLLGFVSLLCYLFYFCNCGSLPTSRQPEQDLITALLSGYNRNIRPYDQVSVDITASLQQIVAIDEKQQIMTSSSFISQTWFDERLSWNTSNYSITVVMLPVKSLWIPDTMILNSADASGYLTVSDYSLASVYYTGQVYMILPALTVRTRCNLFVRKFPFDKQMCSINLTAWSQGSNRILYTENNSLVIDISGYNEHPLWKLDGTDMIVMQAEDRAPFEDTYNAIISIQLYLQRKPLFFMMNGIFACFILNCVTLLSYSLPFASQIGLCMICFMTYSVYSLNFSSLFPQQSEYLMMITLYFLLSICWTLISMLWFIIYNYFTTKAEMPKSLYIFCGLLQRMFFCCFPSSKQDQKKNFTAENNEIKNFANNEATNIDKQQGISIENMESIRTSSNKVKPIETETANAGVWHE